MSERSCRLQRQTRETQIEMEIDLEGNRRIDVSTGLGFFDHMLTALAFHANWDLTLQANGDLHVDDHHTVEDCGLVIGEALGRASATSRAFAGLDTLTHRWMKPWRVA